MVSNRWRKATYTLWAPFYDWVAGSFARRRERSIGLLGLKAGEKVLLIGAGTGLDLPYLPEQVVVSAIDLTPAMLERLRVRAGRLGRQVDARVMDAHRLEFGDASFDAVVLHLIVAVVPDSVACIKEAARVLRPAGRAVMLDKFVREAGRPWLLQRLVNPVASVVATEVNRRLGEILAAAPELRVVHEEPAAFGGMLRMVLVEKRAGEGIGQAG